MMRKEVDFLFLLQRFQFESANETGNQPANDFMPNVKKWIENSNRIG